jgi:CO/xanthine dehydrogenase Mo-binding subunit
MLAEEIKKIGSVVLGADSPKDVELEGGFVRRKDNPEAALPFMACGAIVNANNAVLPLEYRDITLNCRYVYVPPHQLPDKERKYGNLTLTYANQIHACCLEVDPETGVYEIVDYGAAAQSIGAATHETFPYDEDGNLLTPNFYDYHVPHALDMPPLKTTSIESPSPFTPLGAKGMGEGGGAGISAVASALQDALRGSGKPVVTSSSNPYHRVWELLRNPEESRTLVEVEER